MPFLVLGASWDEPVTIKIGNESAQNRNQEKLIGATIDNNLTYNPHVAELCQKARNELYALSRVAICLDDGKLRHSIRAL